MFKTDAIKFFGNGVKAAEAASVTSAAVSAWGEIIPERCAQRLAEVSGGALVFDKELYQRIHKTRYRNRKNKYASKNTPTTQKESD